MTKQILSGYVYELRWGDARNWSIAEIREATGYNSLIPGTLNVKLDASHTLRSDFHLPREQRTDGRNEDLDFERCRLVMQHGTVRALIARTSTNFWGDEVLEIMAEEHLRSRYGLNDKDQVSVEIWIGADAAAEAEAESK
jgi:CTP-dependent riboflavin kinase